MKNNKKRITAFIMLTFMLLGMSNCVWATDSSSDTAGTSGAVTEKNGSGQGFDREDSVLTELVQDGTITQEEMDRITEYLNAKRAEMQPADKPTGGAISARPTDGAISARPTGGAISADQQQTPPDQENHTEMWDEMVTAGIITQAQADAIAAKMEANSGKIVSGSAAAASGSSGVGIKIDNQTINLDPSPRIDNGKTLAPLRGIFEALGLTVSWDASTQTIVGTKDDTEITLKINSNTAMVNGTSVSLDVPAQILDGSTFVPVRFIADSLGVNVNWNSQDKTVEITTN